MYGRDIEQIMDQPGKDVNPARGQLKVHPTNNLDSRYLNPIPNPNTVQHT